MFIPISTDRPRKRPTRITYALIALNAIIFLVQSAAYRMTPDATEQFLNILALSSTTPPHTQFHPWALVTYQFIHANFMHILGNMLFLFVFGPPVEDRFGRVGFLAFYLVGGVAAGAIHHHHQQHRGAKRLFPRLIDLL